MKKPNWKTIAIIFMVLFAIETTIFVWGYVATEIEYHKANTCYYDICENYLDAEYYGNVCTCYEEGFLGEYVIAKEEYLK